MDRDAKAMELAWEIVTAVYGISPSKQADFLKSLASSIGVDYTKMKGYLKDPDKARLGVSKLEKVAFKWASLVGKVADKIKEEMDDK